MKYISTGILAALFVFALVKHDGLHVVLTGGFLALQILLMIRGLMSRLFYLLLPLTVLIFMLGSRYIFNLYITVDWYDKFVHIITTFVVTLLFAHLVQHTKLKSLRSQPLLFVIVIASLGIALGVAWEVFEWIFTPLVPEAMNAGEYDLITDLIVDSIGAIAAAVLGLFLSKKTS